MAAHDVSLQEPADRVGLDLPEPHVVERVAFGTNGWPMLALCILSVVGGAALGIAGLGAEAWWAAAAGCAILLLGLIVSAGLTAVAPGEARVVQLLGRYTGTIRT